MAAVVQIAYAVDDVESAAVEFASTFGCGPFFVRHHPAMACVSGDGTPGQFLHSSAYGQWGEIQVELVVIEGMSASRGIHHVAQMVPDLDSELARLAGRGWPLFLEARTDRGMRFAFCDSRADLGHLTELYEPVPALLDLYAGVRAAARGWDGTDPVRSLSDLPAVVAG